MTLLIVAGHSLAIYLFLVLILSRLGRSLMAGLTPYQYLIVALLGSAVETGLYSGSASVGAGMVSATTLILADRVTSHLMARWAWLRRVLVGVPIVLLQDGNVIPGNLRRARLTENDVRAAVREHGYENLDEIRLAVMECSGRIGVVPRDVAEGG